jgi:hypothetical protein
MAENDATQTDAQEHEMAQGFKDEPTEAQEDFKEEFPEEELSPRQKAIEEVVVKRNESFEEEINEEFPSEEVEEVKEEVLAKPDPVWQEGEDWYTTIKVDGEDIKVPFSDLKSSHQKDKASQKRFEEAAEYGRRVQHREAQLNAYVQRMQQQQQVQRPQPPSQDAEPEQEQPDDPKELIKKYHEALYEDDADKAAELFKALTNKGRSEPAATPNVDQAVQQALQRAMAQQHAQNQRQQQWAYQKSLEDAVKWFDNEYPDIANTPELRAVADNRTIELTQSNPDWSPQQIMQEAAETTRQWAKEFLSPNKNERADRKRKIVQHPKATNASSRIGEEEPVPETAADIIEEMKRVRGQVIQ